MSNCPPISRLQTTIQHYAWGSREAIARMQGRPAAEQPEAELWVGTHPVAPSRVLALPDQPTLGEWIARDPEGLLGPACLQRFGPTLPYLVKILAAAEPLSIQLHPDAREAVEGFAAEERAGLAIGDPRRCYRDPRAKIEMLIALDPFEGLCGLRSDEDVARWIAASGSARLAALAEEARSAAPTGERAAHVFEALARLGHEPAADLQRELACFASEEAGAAPERRWLAELLRRHPTDPMVAAPLVLHCVSLAPGQALQVAPGVPHAYLRGTGIEVMTDSDNVVRGGLTRKHVDRPALALLLRRHSAPPPLVEPQRVSPGVERYAGPTPAYEVMRVRLSGEACELEGGLPTVVLCEVGPVELRSPRSPEAVPLDATEAAFVPAACARFTLAGTGTAFVVAPARARTG